jgi:hypothetical protein
VSDEQTNRPVFLIQRYPMIFDTTREVRLPKWVKAKLADLRLLLLQEAGRYEKALEEIDRLEQRYHQ